MEDFTSLSLDLGSTFGWAYARNGVIERSGEILLTAKDTHPGHRWLKFQEWLYQWKDVDQIMYEDVSGGQSWVAGKIYGCQLSLVLIFSLVHGIRLRALPPKTVKKKFSGNGNADKFAMCEVAINLGWRGGKRGTDFAHNECDAVALMWSILTADKITPQFAQ